MVKNLHYERIKFSVYKKYFSKIGIDVLALTCFVRKIVWFILFIYQTKTTDEQITDENKSHYVYIKNCNKIMCNKRRCKNKKHFCRYSFQSFSSGRVLVDRKKPL